jgi:hypothetical protein
MARAGVRGMVLAVCNTVVVAFCIVMMAPHMAQPGAMFEVFLLIAIVGCLFCVPIGYGLGVLAGALTTRKAPRPAILAVLIVIACATVAWLGHVMDAGELVVYSCIPTIVSCSVLERWTRPDGEPPVPTAVVCYPHHL